MLAVAGIVTNFAFRSLLLVSVCTAYSEGRMVYIVEMCVVTLDGMCEL